MERWTFMKYQRPYLELDAVRVAPDARELTVGAWRREYALDPGPLAIADLAERVQALRDPSTPLWSDLRSGRTSQEWCELVQQMDDLGLVRDEVSRGDAARERVSELTELDDAIAAAIEQARTEAGPAASAALEATARRALGHLRALLDACLRELAPGLAPACAPVAGSLSLTEILELDDFYLRVLLLDAMYWRRSAPLSLAAGYRVVAALTGEPPAEPWSNAAHAFLRSAAGGVYVARDACLHLRLLATALARSTAPGSSMRSTYAWAPQGPMTGTAFGLEAERVAVELVDQLGVPGFLEAVRAPDAPLALVQGFYLEEYHVNRRFVEAMLPLMAKRLRAAVRDRIFRYYAEEVGHEKYEFESCLGVGLSEAEVHATWQLPLRTAYIDLFTVLSEVNPIGFFVSQVVTEGFLGRPSGIDEPVAAIVRRHGKQAEGATRHAAVNKAFHHSSIARLFMSEVPVVSEQDQQVALGYMQTLIELNHRAWGDLLLRYGGSGNGHLA